MALRPTPSQTSSVSPYPSRQQRRFLDSTTGNAGSNGFNSRYVNGGTCDSTAAVTSATPCRTIGTCCNLMLGSKKNSLFKKVWGKRIRAIGSNRGANSYSGSSNDRAPSQTCERGTCQAAPFIPTNFSERHSVFFERNAKQFVNRLKCTQLINLENALLTGVAGPCVLVPREDVPLGDTRVPPTFLSMALWRWPDLPQDADLRSVPSCTQDHMNACINPYHSSVVHNPYNSSKLKDNFMHLYAIYPM